MTLTINRVATIRTLTIITAILSLACSIGGCKTLDNIRVDDKNTRDAAGSIVIRPKALLIHEGHGGQGGFELAYERHRGAGSQTVDAGHYVTFGSVKASGPQQIANQADNEHWDLSYNHLFKFGRYFELEPTAGLAYETTEVNALGSVAPIPTLRLKESKWGFNTAITPRFKINEYVAIEVRIRSSTTGAGDFSETRFPALVLKPIPNVALHVGYMLYRQDIDKREGTSDIRIRLEGPSAALRFSF